MKSGSKGIKFSHRVIYELKKDQDVELFDLVEDMQRMKITSLYTLLFAALKKEYKTIEEMLDDMLEEEFTNYIEVISEAVGKLFGESSKVE